MKDRLFIKIAFLFCFLPVNAQNQKDSLTFDLKIKWSEFPLELSKTYISKNKDTLQLDQLKFYLSDIQIQFDDNSIFREGKSHLIDIENLNSLSIPICKNNKKAISKILFSIGVDSLASVSGALSGDLDPSKGMYWAWQSGYINMKIEGTSSSCKTRKRAFHFHIGGYLEPNYAMRKIALQPKDNNLEIIMDMAVLFENVSLSENNSIMIPGKKAMELADISAKMFKTK
ncbi:MbnP family protein [Flavobacterium sp.]|uniref:MbnP family protein n=1 Tax=Flavobacterium sp. TaxID=239 RepID=UPI0026058E82|nr:MbnP family protein [Flavobacterium sp.]